MAVADTQEIFRFSRFSVEPARRILAADGVQVALSSRAFDLLLLLIENRDRVVTRDEIMRHLWPGLTVEAANIGVQMSALRRALGDQPETPELIATIQGRGYRFIGTLQDDAKPAPPSEPEDFAAPSLPERPMPVQRPGWHPAWYVGFAAIAAAAAGVLGHQWHRPPPPEADAAPRLSIVVLAFRNLSDKPGQDYLVDAITDDLTTDLSHIPGVLVIARETADSFKGREATATEIGRELNVRYMLEGSIRALETGFRVNAQLIETLHGTHLWAERFDVARDRLSEAQDAIVAHIASSLDVKLIAAEDERARRERAENPDAMDLYLRARAMLDRDSSLQGLTNAQRMAERALALDPDLVPALTDLGHWLLGKVATFDDPDESADVARARDDRAGHFAGAA